MAEAAVQARLTTTPTESRPLAECIGQVLREDVYAERDNPPFDRVLHGRHRDRQRAFARGVRRFRIEATAAGRALRR